jgi:hypothetical protein
LTQLNLEANAKISPGLQKDIDFVLASRQVLKSFCRYLCKPLEKKLIPLAIRGLLLNSSCDRNPDLVHYQESKAGPILLLVRAAVLNEAKVVKVAAL